MELDTLISVLICKCPQGYMSLIYPDLGQDCELRFLQSVVRREALGPSRTILCKYRHSYVMRLQMESWIGYECGSNARVWDISKET